MTDAPELVHLERRDDGVAVLDDLSTGSEANLAGVSDHPDLSLVMGSVVDEEVVDALVREAAVASLGAIGDQRAVATIIAACSDKPAVRRRAVLALAPFEGDDVEAAIDGALEDRDWQVRQAAEDLRSAQSSRRPDTSE